MKLTKNFTLEEFIVSEVAVRYNIDNTPSEEECKNIKNLCVKILQPLRDYTGPILVSSGYRSAKLNKKVKGSKTSQHVSGQAADIKTQNMRKAFLYIQNNLPFDQLIWEYGDDKQPSWIHVSYGPRNRRQVLRATKEGYVPFKLK